MGVITSTKLDIKNFIFGAEEKLEDITDKQEIPDLGEKPTEDNAEKIEDPEIIADVIWLCLGLFCLGGLLASYKRQLEHQQHRCIRLFYLWRK